MNLFDVVISKLPDNINEILLSNKVELPAISQYPSFVFTCTSAPEFVINSIRITPAKTDYYNQDVYDGPKLQSLPIDIQVFCGYLLIKSLPINKFLLFLTLLERTC